MTTKDDVVLIYDTTLREGSQSPGISLSVSDKIKIVAALDDMGIPFIEGGMPDTNPKEDEFYRQIVGYPFKNAEFVPFGATLRVGLDPEEDQLLAALAETPFRRVCVYGKTDLLSVREVLKTEPGVNVDLIDRTVRFLRGAGKKVVFDCEGFFAGYCRDKDYALGCVKAAAEAGADMVVLCDTNGTADPRLVEETVNVVRNMLKEADLDVVVGIHAHNDCGMADANTVTAVTCGAKLVNTTLFGVGERAGNANFFTVVPNLQLRYGKKCISAASMRSLAPESRKLAEIIGVKLPSGAPFVGRNAFSHKAGTHINAVLKEPGVMEAVDPAEVGGERRLLASEITGRSGMQEIISRIGEIDVTGELTSQILAELKQREFYGYQYESAEASLELLVRRMAGKYRPAFLLNGYKVITLDEKTGNPYSASAIVDLTVDGQSEITAGNGIGPVDALDCAFRRAMAHFYPETLGISLVDYKVRVIDSGEGTASKVRVFIEFIGNGKRFGTVGVSGDIIQASWAALVDAYEYWIMKGQD
jgi:2-isopropylmalate synthase